MGEDTFVMVRLFVNLFLGWPLYLLTNATGGRTKWDLKTKVTYYLHFLAHWHLHLSDTQLTEKKVMNMKTK